MNEVMWRAHVKDAERAEELANTVIELYKNSGFKKSVWPAKARMDGVITRSEYYLIREYAWYIFKE